MKVRRDLYAEIIITKTPNYNKQNTYFVASGIVYTLVIIQTATDLWYFPVQLCTVVMLQDCGNCYKKTDWQYTNSIITQP